MGADARGEWIAAKLSPIGLASKAEVEVAMAARHDLRVLEKDQSFEQEAMNKAVKAAYDEPMKP